MASWSWGGAISGAIAGFATGGPYGAIAGFFVGGLAVGDAQRSARNKARSAYNDAQKDRDLMVQSATAPHKIVYGRAKVSGPIAFVHASGAKGEMLHLVVVLAGHECDAVETVYLNDTALTLDANGWCTDEAFTTRVFKETASIFSLLAGESSMVLPSTPSRVYGVSARSVAGDDTPITGYTVSGATITLPYGVTEFSVVTVHYQVNTSTTRYVRVIAHLGSATQAADADLIAESGGKWTADHRLRGLTYMYVRLEYSQDIFGATGLPDISAVVRGRKVWDPNNLVAQWSDNAALCTADFLRTYMGASAAEVPDAEVGDEADVCHQAVPLDASGATQKRYTCNGVLSTESTPRDNLSSLLEAMAGSCVWVQGRYLLRAGAHRAAELTITEDMLADGPVEIQQGAPRSELTNRIVATYQDPSASYATVEAPAVTNSSYVAADGGLDLPTTVRFDMCTDAMRAQRLAKIMLERSRQSLRVKLNCSLKAYDVAPGSTVALTLTRYGWAGKLFTVLERTHSWDTQTVALVLVETAAGVWDWAYGQATAVDLAPNTSLPDPWARPADIVGQPAASRTAHLQRLPDGTVLTRAWVSWTPVDDVNVQQGGQIRVRWRQGDADWVDGAPVQGGSAGAYIGPLDDGQMTTVQVLPVTQLGRSAAQWAALSFIALGKTEPPSQVAALYAEKDPSGVRLSWPAVSDVDLVGYELRIGGSTWGDAQPLAKTAGTTHFMAAVAAGTRSLWIKAVDSSGNLSASATSLALVIGVPAAPVLAWQLQTSDEVLSWSVPASDYGIDRYEIRHGATWATGVSVGAVKGSVLRRRADWGGSRTYWVAAIDIAGNVGTPGSVSTAIEPPGSVGSRRAETVDNNALLYWTKPTAGSLPVASYDIKRGASYAGGTDLGDNASSTFTTVFEQVAGTYTYWIAPIDTAGNIGTPASITARVTSPPDYVLRVDVNSSFGGTKTNLALLNGDLIGPISTTETWSAHFSSRGWASPQAQVSAGYPLYAHPSLTTATYDESFDAGTLLQATTISVTLATTTLSGSVSTAVQIYYRALVTDAWTAAPAGTSALASGFRYYRVVVTLTATAGANLLRIDSLNVKLALKLRTDSGTGTISNAATGVVVPFGVAFIDADTPIVQPQGSTPLIPVVDFTDAPNPTSFTVYLYTTAGAKTTGSFSWTARGY